MEPRLYTVLFIFRLNGSQSSLNGSPRNLHTNLRDFFYPIPKNLALKTSNFKRQSGAHNFETAQRIDKTISFNCDKCRKNGTELGESRGFDAT